jgi:hypothetical protein
VIAVIGYLIAASVAIAAVVLAAGPRRVSRRDETLEVSELASRLVSIFGGLAGFAVTGIVLLVTLSRNVPDAGGTPLTTILTMFVVAYLGNFTVSVQLATVSSRVNPTGFDLGAAQYAGATISQYFVFIGWLALRPLFETFGLIRMADVVSYFLVAAVAIGYGPLATILHRTGFASFRMIVLTPLIASLVSVAYFVVLRLSGIDRVPDATLALTIVGFIPGVFAQGVLAIMPILARSDRINGILAERAHLLILSYAVSVMVLIYFLLLSVLGLA